MIFATGPLAGHTKLTHNDDKLGTAPHTVTGLLVRALYIHIMNVTQLLLSTSSIQNDRIPLTFWNLYMLGPFRGRGGRDRSGRFNV